MYRDALQLLIDWKSARHRKPLLIEGARQVGKTWLMKEFGVRYFSQTAYVNFDEDITAKRIFDHDYDIKRITTALAIHCGCPIIPKETLLIFDEIQEAPLALTALKYFCEKAPQYPIIAAGSLLGLASHSGTGFPVGKVDFLKLYPMTFTEFLRAAGKQDYVELLQQQDWTMISTFKETFVEYLRYYYFVGGMPEAVEAFANDRDFAMVRKIQERLLDSYERDFSKHAPNAIVPRIRLVWNSLPSQLAKENRKFIFGALRKSARALDFELAIEWLKDSGLIYLSHCISKPDLPLVAYKETFFKMFMLDVGLLGAKSNLSAQTIVDGNRIFEEFKGALTEQYVCQQLIAECKLQPFYWSAQNSSGEVDFVFQNDQSVVPLEVKAEENLKAKSLFFFTQKYRLQRAMRSSMSNYRKDDIAWKSKTDTAKSTNDEYAFTLFNVPLYAISQINRLHNAN